LGGLAIGCYSLFHNYYERIPVSGMFLIGTLILGTLAFTIKYERITKPAKFMELGIERSNNLN
jgi:hypothetical protein